MKISGPPPLPATAPFRERLRRQVGTWSLPFQRRDDGAQDDALAVEGLAGDPPLLRAELDWLVSSEATRAHVFVCALGRHDERAVLLPGLRERAGAGRAARHARRILARYLGARAKAGGPVEEVLRDMRAAPGQALALARCFFELGATPERVAWIAAALRDGALDAPAVEELTAYGAWEAEMEEDELCSLAGALVEGGAIEHPTAALAAIVPRVQRHPSSLARLAAPLLRAVERLAPHPLGVTPAHQWGLGAGMLLQCGMASQVASLALIILSRREGPADFAWTTLRRAGKRDRVAAWKALSAALDGGAAASRLLDAFVDAEHDASEISWPCAEVMAWVGSDEQRALAALAVVRRHAPQMDPILWALVQRFGAHGSVADRLMNRIRETHDRTGLAALSSLGSTHLEQGEDARPRLIDPDPEIASFAKRVVELVMWIEERSPSIRPFTQYS